VGKLNHQQTEENRFAGLDIGLEETRQIIGQFTTPIKSTISGVLP
jgi:hypothetical protein